MLSSLLFGLLALVLAAESFWNGLQAAAVWADGQRRGLPKAIIQAVLSAVLALIFLLVALVEAFEAGGAVHGWHHPHHRYTPRAAPGDRIAYVRPLRRMRDNIGRLVQTERGR